MTARRFGQASSPATSDNTAPVAQRRFGQSSSEPASAQIAAPAAQKVLACSHVDLVRARQAVLKPIPLVLAVRKKRHLSRRQKSRVSRRRPSVSKQPSSLISIAAAGSGWAGLHLPGKAARPFRVARYRWLADQLYQRIDKGGTLPRNFWLARYFVTDYAAFGLTAPADGFQWIRYGHDILLIDSGIGAAADVITDFFEESGDAADMPLNNGEGLAQ